MLAQVGCGGGSGSLWRKKVDVKREIAVIAGYQKHANNQHELGGLPLVLSCNCVHVCKRPP